MSKPLISYVLTAYNIEEFIAESVQYAFAQTYSPLEIILSDDCSTDKTYEIMCSMTAEYKGPHQIILNRNESNLGITKHMNRAYLELANGDIIVSAHGDDISFPERTQKSYDFLSANPDFTAVSFCMKAIDKDGKPIPGSQHSVLVDHMVVVDFEKGGNIPAPSRAFYKSVMTEFGPLRDDCPTEDELISFRSLMFGKNALLPGTMVLYRKHEKSSSNPVFFSKFPLEKILLQQDADMEYAVKKGLLTEQQRTEKYISLVRLMKIRKTYRNFLAHGSLKDFLKLICLKEIDMRQRLHYFKEAILKGFR